MEITEIKKILENKIIFLLKEKGNAISRGDLDMVVDIEKKISETENSIHVIDDGLSK